MLGDMLQEVRPPIGEAPQRIADQRIDEGVRADTRHHFGKQIAVFRRGENSPPPVVDLVDPFECSDVAQHIAQQRRCGGCQQQLVGKLR